MSLPRTQSGKPNTVVRPVVELTADEARAFFLEPENYCSIDLPPYFRFDKLLRGASNVLRRKELKTLQQSKPRDFDNVNHSLYNNKDGKYAWRPLQIVHPAIYVSLVNAITAKASWTVICDRFDHFQACDRITCLSIPLRSGSKQSHKAEQISLWWQRVEQASIELSIEYDYTIHTDIVDCYGAIYTHSISWALHTKAEAKKTKNRTNESLIGNIIDWHIQDMRYGQTNGIPQGSVLMDFIAEIVLGYADEQIFEQLADCKIDDYQILRYRDDYRVFTNSSQDAERILKCITEVLIGLGLKLGPGKTKLSDSVIRASVKEDKVQWICRKQVAKSLQKQLMIVHNHSLSYPNAGSLIAALSSFHKRVVKMKKINDAMPIVGILVDIAFHNPRTYPIFAAILSRLLRSLKSKAKAKEVMEKIKRKFDKLPNTGHMQLWLQRISYPISADIDYSEPLCQLVAGKDVTIWNNEWISSNDLKTAIDGELIVDRQKLKSIAPVIPVREMALFVARDDYE